MELEAPADQRGHESVDVGSRMREHEVFAAGFPDQTRVAPVTVDVGSDGAPHLMEDRRRPREVDPGELFAREHRIAHGSRGARKEVDDARRESRFLEKLHQEPCRVHRRRRGLPHDRVAHQRGSRRKIARDRREVERRHGEDEPLERPVFEGVPHARRRNRLLRIDLAHEVHVEAEKIDQLAGRVDFGLMAGLALSEHRRGVQPHAPRPGEKVRGLEEDGRAGLPRHPRPCRVRVARGGDGTRHLACTRLVPRRKDVPVIVRGDGRRGGAGADAAAGDHRRDLDGSTGHDLQRVDELASLGTIRCVTEDRLVVRDRDVDDGVGHDRLR